MSFAHSGRHPSQWPIHPPDETGFLEKEPMLPKGLVIVHTGNGKGKTTAALGLALRAVGQGLKVAIVQFIKGSWKYGELRAPEFLPGLEILPLGLGFIHRSEGKPSREDIAAAHDALRVGREKVLSKQYDLVILDEINYAVSYGLVDQNDVLALIREKPPELHLVLTGRDATSALVEAADLVTEMREIKHPSKQGVPAQRGIDF